MIPEQTTATRRPLSPARLDELNKAFISHERRMGIAANVDYLRDYGGMAAADYRAHVPALLAHIEAQAEYSQHSLALRDAAEARAATLEAQVAGLQQEQDRLLTCGETLTQNCRLLLERGELLSSALAKCLGMPWIDTPGVEISEESRALFARQFPVASTDSAAPCKQAGPLSGDDYQCLTDMMDADALEAAKNVQQEGGVQHG